MFLFESRKIESWRGSCPLLNMQAQFVDQPRLHSYQLKRADVRQENNRKVKTERNKPPLDPTMKFTLSPKSTRVLACEKKFSCQQTVSRKTQRVHE